MNLKDIVANKFLLGIFVIFSLSLSYSFGNYENFVEKLKNLGVSENNLIEKSSISRYEITKYLNIADCFDCSSPNPYWHQRLNNQWWIDFKNQPGNYFSDILYKSAVRSTNDYFYCVAYAGLKGYVNGFPTSSAFCGGRYCGANNATYAEVIQAMINIVGEQVHNKYNVKWSDVDNWLKSIDKNSQIYKNLNIQDLQNITNGKNTCGTTECKITSTSQLQTYLKYCTHNINACNFNLFSNLNNGDWPIAEINVLYNEKVLDYNEANTINVYSPINGKDLMSYLYKISLINDCDFDLDYDKDGILNSEDSCLYEYNPSQNDLDSDGIGNVCDNDIDGDGITNTVGAVDDNNSIIISKAKESDDNCIMLKNSDQADSNNDGKGDVCSIDTTNKGCGLSIVGAPTFGQAPLLTNFKLNTSCAIKEVQWDFGNYNYSNINSPSTTYYQPGLYQIKAKIITNTNEVKTATMSITVGPKPGEKSGFYISCSPLSGTSPLEFQCKANYQGKINNIEWLYQGKKVLLNPNEIFTGKIEQTGEYPIQGTAYKQGNEIGISQANISIQKDGSFGSYLRANNLMPNSGEEISFTTTITGFNENDINIIEWHYGDGNPILNKSLTSTKSYIEGGNYNIIQKIYLKSGKLITNKLNIFVTKTSGIGDISSNITADTLTQTVNKNINFTLKTTNIANEDIASIVWRMGDGTNKTFSTDIGKAFNYSHLYKRSGNFTIYNTVFTKNNTQLNSSMTVEITSGVDCSNKIGTYKCDIDKDGIPDVCDDDIDGDGIPNLLNILSFENSNCSFSGNFNLQTLTQEFNASKKGANLDNCPFSSNQEQEDSDSNGIGDICESMFENLENNDDQDNDGIIDSEDACPMVPEDYDGIEDGDGCPEFDELSNNWENKSYISVTPCNQCPCEYADFSSTMRKFDQIRAILLDSQGKIIYKSSNIVTIQGDIKKSINE
ncbi:MAG: thrombospondin type 3 repeat-containing protein [Candidatus Absconditabacteria bacterium]